MSPEKRDETLFRVVMFVLVGAFFVPFLLVLSCAESEPQVKAVRAANNDAARALVVAEKLEVARIRAIAISRMDECPKGDTDCRVEAVDSTFEDEKPRIDAIHRAVQTQHEVAAALVAYDECSKASVSVAACRAKASAALLPLAPLVADLVRGVP